MRFFTPARMWTLKASYHTFTTKISRKRERGGLKEGKDGISKIEVEVIIMMIIIIAVIMMLSITFFQDFISCYIY